MDERSSLKSTMGERDGKWDGKRRGKKREWKVKQEGGMKSRVNNRKVKRTDHNCFTFPAVLHFQCLMHKTFI